MITRLRAAALAAAVLAAPVAPSFLQPARASAAAPIGPDAIRLPSGERLVREAREHGRLVERAIELLRERARQRDERLTAREKRQVRRASEERLRDRIRVLREQVATGGAPDVPIPAALASIAQCESGGDPTAIGGGGKFRGKYQFDLQTWASVGGSGDPAAAPEAEQDRRAAMLYARAGAAPWPVCGS